MYRLQMILDHLAQAERHIRQGETLVRRQQQLVRNLELDRHPQTLAKAKDLLEKFEKLQQMHVTDRDRLLAEAVELRQAPHNLG
jgi:hypothetical protein